MTVLSEGMKIGDVVQHEAPLGFSRKKITIGHNQTLVIGQPVQDDPANPGEYMALAAAVNDVQTFTFGAAMTAGTIEVGVISKEGNLTKFSVAFAVNWAGTIAALNTAMDAALGAGSVVATGAATTLILTFSGANYAGKAQPAAMIDVSGATGVTTCVWAHTTQGNIAGGAVAGILLTEVTTGAHPEVKPAVLLIRDAIVDKQCITYGANIDTTNKKAAVDAILEANRIRVSAGPTYTVG